MTQIVSGSSSPQVYDCQPSLSDITYEGNDSYIYNGRSYYIRLFHEGENLESDCLPRDWREIALRAILSAAQRGVLPGSTGNENVKKVEMNYEGEYIIQEMKDSPDSDNGLSQRIVSALPKSATDEQIPEDLALYNEVCEAPSYEMEEKGYLDHPDENGNFYAESDDDREFIGEPGLDSLSQKNDGFFLDATSSRTLPAKVPTDIKSTSYEKSSFDDMVLESGTCPGIIDNPEEGRERSSSLSIQAGKLFSDFTSSIVNLWDRRKGDISPKDTYEKDSHAQDKAYLQSIKAMYERQLSVPWEESWDEVDYERFILQGDTTPPTMETSIAQLRQDLPRSLIDYNGRRLLESDVPLDCRGLIEPKIDGFSAAAEVKFLHLLPQTGAASLLQIMNEVFIPEAHRGILSTSFYQIKLGESSLYKKLENFLLDISLKSKREGEIKLFLDNLIFCIEHAKGVTLSDFDLSSEDEQEILGKFIKLSDADKKQMICLLSMRLSYIDEAAAFLPKFSNEYRATIDMPKYPFSYYSNAIATDDVNDRKIMVHKMCKFELNKSEDLPSSDKVATIIAESVIDFNRKRVWVRFKILDEYTSQFKNKK